MARARTRGPWRAAARLAAAPSCASLDTPAAPRRAARCANSGSAGRALKGTRALFFYHHPPPYLPPPRTPSQLCRSPPSPRNPVPSLPQPGHGMGIWGGSKGLPPGKVGQGGDPAAKGLTPLLLTPLPPLPPEPRRRAPPPRCSDSSAVAKVQARSAPIGQSASDARLRRFPLAVLPSRLRPPRAPRRGRE